LWLLLLLSAPRRAHAFTFMKGFKG